MSNFPDEKKYPAELDVQVKPVSDHDQENENKDAVFGAITEDGPNYRNVGWIGTTVLLLKAQLGLGVLSIPSVLSTLGLIPGVISILAISAFTTWSDYVIGTFKLRHREIYNLADVFNLWFGPTGRAIVGVIYCVCKSPYALLLVYMIFCAGSGMLSLSIALNAISVHGACTAIFVVVAAVAVCFISSIQTLGKIQLLGYIGVASIVVALLTLTVAVGVQERPSAAPQTGPWDKKFVLFGDPTFAEASSSLAALVFAFCGTPGFFGIISEMRDPRLYTRAVCICQSFLTAMYITVGVVVYYFCGQYVASPALGSAGPLLKKICYGIAIPALAVSSLIVTHLPAKFLFVTFMRDSPHLNKNTPKHWIVWLGCVIGCTLISYVIASAIPVFGGLISLIGALFGTFMSMQPYVADLFRAFMWFYDNWHLRKNATLQWRALAAWNVLLVVAGTFLMVCGTYGSIMDIITSYKASGGSAAWSCADNSNSV